MISQTQRNRKYTKQELLDAGTGVDSLTVLLSQINSQPCLTLCYTSGCEHDLKKQRAESKGRTYLSMPRLMNELSLLLSVCGELPATIPNIGSNL